MEDFIYYVASSYTLIWVNTIEYDRCTRNLSYNCNQILNSNCFIWDIVNGIQPIDMNKKENKHKSNYDISNEDITPIQPINFICSLKEKHNIIFCKDYHLYLNNSIQSIDLWRLLLNNINNLKQNNNIFVIVSPFTKLLPEIERYFTVLDFTLPNKDELLTILSNFIDTLDNQNKELVENILNNGLGLTELEFENILALSIAEYGEINPLIIFEQKKQLLKRNSYLELCNSDKDFESIAGLDILKDFAKKMVLSGNGRGICLVGVSGTGKSYFAKCLGKETNRIIISLDFGRLMGGIVGETERNTIDALNLIDTMSPCILFIDEIEKGLAGINSNSSDGGVSIRQGGQFLKWLNDHKNEVFVVCTANDVSRLPSELLRAERWDAIFFIDLPSKMEQGVLLDMYKKIYSITDNEYIDLEKYTGAEIKSLCRLSSSLKISLNETKKYITPVYKIYREKIEQLQEWSKDRTINASSLQDTNEVNNLKTTDNLYIKDNNENIINFNKRR